MPLTNPTAGAPDPAADQTNFMPQGPVYNRPLGNLPDPDANGGTGANSPKYSALDITAAALRNTVQGRAFDDLVIAGSHQGPPDDINWRYLGAGSDPRKADPNVAIPPGEEWRASKYGGLFTPEEIQQRYEELQSQDRDAQALMASKHQGLIGFAAGNLDVIGAAAMLTPAAPTRLANAVRFAITGGATSAAQQIAMRQIDPNAPQGLYENALNLGEGTLLAGILGGVLHHGGDTHQTAADIARIQETLKRDLAERIPTYVAPEGDTAERIAADVRQRLAEHSQRLQQAAAEAHAAAQGIDPQAAQDRLQAAQAALDAHAEPPPEAREAAIAQEVERLQQPESVRERLEATYGEDLPHVLRERAVGRLWALWEETRAGLGLQTEHAAALEDQARAQAALEAREQLERFHAEHNPEPVPEPPYELSHEFQGLRSDVSPTEGAGAAAPGESGEPVPGGPAGRNARGVEGAGSRSGEPLPVYRGGRRLSKRDFEPARLTAETGRPTSALGPVFTGTAADAAAMGPVTEHHLNIEHPLELRHDELPNFASNAEATAWRNEQIAAGHDGLVIDASHAGGPTYYIPFQHEQVLPTTRGGGHRSGWRPVSGAPNVEHHVLDALASTDRYTPKEAQAYAALIGEGYHTLADRLGITPDALFDMAPLHITGEALPGGLAQALADPFYSAAIRGVESLPMTKASPEQWLKTLENLTTKGVTKEELEWMGVRPWLESRTGTVTREQLLEHMRANQVAVKEIRNGYDVARERELVDRLGAMGYDITPGDYPGESPVVTDRATGEERDLGDLPADAAHIVMDLDNLAESVRYDQYNLPGGSNNKEHLLTLDRPTNVLHERKAYWASQENKHHAQIQTLENMIRRSVAEYGEKYEPVKLQQWRDELAGTKKLRDIDQDLMDHELSKLDPGVDYAARRRIAAEYEEKIRAESRRQGAIRDHDAMMDSRDRIRELERERDEELAKHGEPTDTKANQPRAYNSGHWSQPNILAHVRTNERIGADGKRELHIEEIQSDWHQAGRESGYDILDPIRREARIQELNRQIDEAHDKYFGQGYDRRVREWLDKHGYPPETDLHEALHDEARTPEQRREAYKFITEREKAGKDIGALQRERNWLYQNPRGFSATALDLIRKNHNDAVDAAKPSVDAIDKAGFPNARDMYNEFLKDPLWWQHYNVPEEHRGPIARALNERRRWAAAEEQVQGGGTTDLLPDAPFKKSWPELAFKAMVRHAAENGFERITWTRGATQAERYTHELRQAVDSIRWAPPAADIGTDLFRNSTVVVSAHKAGRPVFTADVDINKGTIKDSSAADAKGKTLAEVIGQDAAQKVLGGEPRGELAGKDLTVGGSGMQGFYDKMLPAFAKKLGKKYGATVGEKELGGDGRGGEHSQTHFDVHVRNELAEEGVHRANLRATVDHYRALHPDAAIEVVPHGQEPDGNGGPAVYTVHETGPNQWELLDDGGITGRVYSSEREARVAASDGNEMRDTQHLDRALGESRGLTPAEQHELTRLRVHSMDPLRNFDVAEGARLDDLERRLRQHGAQIGDHTAPLNPKERGELERLNERDARRNADGPIEGHSLTAEEQIRRGDLLQRLEHTPLTEEERAALEEHERRSGLNPEQSSELNHLYSTDNLEELNERDRERIRELEAIYEAGRLYQDDLTPQETLHYRDLERRAANLTTPPPETPPAVTVHSMDIPPAMRDAALAGQPLFQGGGRGAYDPSTHTMSITAARDLSTFVHEAGHHFLDLYTEIGAYADAPLSIRQDVQTLMDWFRVKDVDAWHAMPLDEQRRYHEAFAQAFERYAAEGVAPSTRLQAVFDQFRKWLTQIYQALTRLDTTALGRAPQAVREVMDRMLATQADIDAARAARVAAAPDEGLRRLAGDDVLRETLRQMAYEQGGWQEIGGSIIRKTEDPSHIDYNVIVGRTKWLPNSHWWPGMPRRSEKSESGFTVPEVQNAVEKALRGDGLGERQRMLLDYMVSVADQRTSSEPFLAHPSDFEGVEHLSAENPNDVWQVAMVSRLASIDEGLVETLARRFENDDTAFMRHVKEALDAHDTDAKLAASGPEESEPAGRFTDGPAAGGPAREAGGGGDEPATGARTADETGGAESGGRARAETDLFGERPTSTQALADEIRRRDGLRNGGQESAETGDPSDLFSQAVRQNDLVDMLGRLPLEERGEFEQRLRDLDHGTPTAAPEGSTVGAFQAANEYTLGDLRLARGGRALGKALGWFYPSLRTLRSPSLAVRRVLVHLTEMPEMLEMNVPTKERPNGVPTPKSVETLLKAWEGKWNEAWRARDDLYRQYKLRDLGPTEPVRLDRHQFNQEVSAAMRRGDRHVVPEVQEAARATRSIAFDPLKAEAEELGLLPKQQELLGGTAESYLMRQYDRAAIRADRVNWHQILADHFEKQGLERAEADNVAHRVTANILGSELGFLDHNPSIFKDLAPTSGRLKARELLMPDVLLEKYLTNDIDVLSHAYIKSLAPQVEITRAFGDKDMIDAFQRVQDEYALLKQRALAQGDQTTANALNRRENTDVRDLKALRDRLYGIFGTPSDPTGWFQRIARGIRSVNAFRFLGTATASHIPDLGNAVLRNGLTRTFATAMKLASSMEALKLTRREMQRMGTAMDMVHNSTAAQLGEYGVESAYAFQKALNRGTRAFTIATLETPWIASTKAWSAAAAHDEILDLAARARAGEALSVSDRTRLNNNGIDQGMLHRIADQFQSYGRTVNGLRMGSTYKWTDHAAAQAVDNLTMRAGESSTLSPGVGDTPLWTSSEVGKCIFQFKTFGAVAIRKLVIPLAQGVARGDLRSASALATLIGAGTATYVLKQLASGQPIEKHPDRFALEVLDKSNLLGWVGEFFYPVLWQFGMGNFSRWGDRQTWETLGGPVAGTAVDAWDLRIPAKIRGQITHNPQDAHFSRGDIHRIRRMLPGNQIWYLRRGVNHLEQKLGDAMGLPPDAPRRED